MFEQTPININLEADLSLSQETNVAVFEVGPGDRDGLQRELLSNQYDFGDNTLDKKIQNDLQMNTQKNEVLAQ